MIVLVLEDHARRAVLVFDAIVRLVASCWRGNCQWRSRKLILAFEEDSADVSRALTFHLWRRRLIPYNNGSETVRWGEHCAGGVVSGG